MINGLCQTGTWGSLGNFGLWGLIGLILTLVFWVGSIGGLALLAVWVLRRGRLSAATVAQTNGQPTAREILQAQYARGEITREQYELKKQDIG